MSERIIKQWHIYTVNLEPNLGTKPGKQRPCLAIQPTLFTEKGIQSVVILPLTSQIKDAFPIRVRIKKGECSLSTDSDIMVDQITSWDISLFKQDLGEIPTALQNQVKDAVRLFLAL